MASSSFSDVSVRSIFPSERQGPYLRVAFVTVFVSNQERSLRFYLDQLGFNFLLIINRKMVYAGSRSLPRTELPCSP